jgi:hypothetical protein
LTSGLFQEHRPVLIVIVVCAALLAVIRGPSLVSRYASARSAASDAMGRLNSMRDLLAVRSRTNRERNAVQAVLDSARTQYFQGRSANLATSALSAHISRIAEAANVALLSVQLAADSSPVPHVRLLTATASARTDVHGLTRFLERIEGGNRIIRVAELSIQQPDVAAGDHMAESLLLRIRLQALWHTTRTQ